jgi:hypothetical protein
MRCNSRMIKVKSHKSKVMHAFIALRKIQLKIPQLFTSYCNVFEGNTKYKFKFNEDFSIICCFEVVLYT